MSRKKRIILIQSSLLFAGLFILLFTYLNFDQNSSKKILTDEVKLEIGKKIKKDSANENIFYDIEYSGIDLSGNRYILKAKEARNDKNIDGLLDLKYVNAVFYFKNDKILNISSDTGMYNNRTLDMLFEKNVKGNYEGSNLNAEKAEYLNTKNLLFITDNVKLVDFRGTMLADKLIFDIKNNTLDISSSGNKKINANLNYKWKKPLEFLSLKKINQYLK